jgi:hypothetical protein
VTSTGDDDRYPGEFTFRDRCLHRGRYALKPLRREADVLRCIRTPELLSVKR